MVPEVEVSTSPSDVRETATASTSSSGHAAAEARRNPGRRARALADAAQQAYQDGALERAEQLLRQAYALDRAPALLHNLARILDAQGRTDAALQMYRRYLEEAPESKVRGRVLRRIDVLQAGLRREGEVRSRRRLLPQLEASDEARPVLPWMVVGAGAVVLGAGGVFGLIARSKESAARREPIQVASTAEISEAETMATTANVLYVAGGLIAAGGVAWLIWGRHTEEAPSVGLMATDRGAVVMGRF